MSLKIKESELRELLDEVAADLAKAFESEKNKLIKAEHSSPEESSSASNSSASPMDKGSASPEGSISVSHSASHVPFEKTAVQASDSAGSGSASPESSPMTQPGSKLNNGVKRNPMTEPGTLGKGEHSMSKDSPPFEGSSASADGGGSADDSGSDQEAPPEATESTTPPADGAPSPDGMDPAADAGAALTPEALQAEYSKLPPEELDMHIQAALAAKAAVAAPSPDASAPMAPPGPSAPVPPTPGPDAMMRNELSPSPERKGPRGMEQVKKSEVDDLKSLIKSQQEDIENLTKSIKLVLEQPQRKAVTSVSHLPKVEENPQPLTKADVHKRLKEIARNPNLKKSDRQLINDYYDGRVSVSKLAPLFEDNK